MVVMGFGLGALLMSKIRAPALMSATGSNLVMVFGILGGIFLAITVPLGFIMKNPPDGFVPRGYTPPSSTQTAAGSVVTKRSVKESILSGQFARMWLILF
jgi:OFA family oxalate/formate antiporter-like MFS transporter